MPEDDTGPQPQDTPDRDADPQPEPPPDLPPVPPGPVDIAERERPPGERHDY